MRDQACATEDGETMRTVAPTRLWIAGPCTCGHTTSARSESAAIRAMAEHLEIQCDLHGAVMLPDIGGGPHGVD